MKRRDFMLALGSSGLAAGVVGCAGNPQKPIEAVASNLASDAAQSKLVATPKPKVVSLDSAIKYPKLASAPYDPKKSNLDKHTIEARLAKSREYDRTYDDDVFVDPKLIGVFRSTTTKLTGVRNAVGFANFNLISFDETIRAAKNHNKIEPFTPEEIQFLDGLFNENAGYYGFYGEKVNAKLTARFAARDAVKIPYTGHYVYQGEPLKLYQRILRELGPTIILTSGIRSIVKQMHLFLLKAQATKGNLSMASRSLAPPGHSYHGIGDFDVGKKGLGADNFTDMFASTKEYNQLIASGFVQIRYDKENLFGVRYEPWHIKVVS